MGLYNVTLNAIKKSKNNFFISLYKKLIKNNLKGIERKYCKFRAKKIINKSDITQDLLWEYIQTVDLFDYPISDTNCRTINVDKEYVLRIRRFSVKDRSFQMDFEGSGIKVIIQTSANKLVVDFNTKSFMYHTVLEECKDEKLYQQIEDFVKFVLYKTYCHCMDNNEYNYKFL